MTYLKRLSDTRALWLSLSATVLITVAFQVITRQFDLVLLDTLSNLDEIRSAPKGKAGSVINRYIDHNGRVGEVACLPDSWARTT